MAEGITDDLAISSQLGCAHTLHQAGFADSFQQSLGQDGDAVIDVHAAPLNDTADKDIAYFVESNVAVAELFGNDGQGSGCGLADAQGQMAGRSPHTNDDIPARRGPGVLGQIADDADADLPGRLETERWRRAGQGEIVVDGLGHMSDTNGAAGLGVNLAAGIGRVVAANRHQHGHVQPAEHVQDVLHVLFRLGGIGTRRTQDGAAAQMDGLDLIDRQLAIVLGITFDQPLKTIAEADNLDALLNGLNGHRADNAIDPRGRTTANQQRQSSGNRWGCHGSTSRSQTGARQRTYSFLSVYRENSL